MDWVGVRQLTHSLLTAPPPAGDGHGWFCSRGGVDGACIALCTLPFRRLFRDLSLPFRRLSLSARAAQHLVRGGGGGTEEMLQPCLICPPVVSLVAM